MRKKLIIRSSALALAVMLIFASVFCAFAEITQTYAITDDAAVFSADEAASLAVKLDEAGSRTGCWSIMPRRSAGTYFFSTTRRNMYSSNQRSVMTIFPL